jgi:hypothetical protein
VLSAAADSRGIGWLASKTHFPCTPHKIDLMVTLDAITIIRGWLMLEWLFSESANHVTSCRTKLQSRQSQLDYLCHL